MLLLVTVLALTGALPVQTIRKVRQATKNSDNLMLKFESLIDNLDKIKVHNYAHGLYYFNYSCIVIYVALKLCFTSRN